MKSDDEPICDELAAILETAALAADLDFSGFKPATLARRARSRMTRMGVLDLSSYAARLALDRVEAIALGQSLLVTTTALFRESETFDLLRSGPLATLAKDRAAQGGTMLRAWVPACSSGEEAVSVAMCLIEAIEQAKGSLAASVLGTDVADQALEQARRGVMRADCASVPVDLARRFLVPGPEGVSPAPELAACIRYAHHDAIAGRKQVPREAVVASFDVIFCRNLLIYLNADAQERLMLRLLKATAPDALLVIGRAERPPHSLRDELEPLRVPLPVYRVRRR